MAALVFSTNAIYIKSQEPKYSAAGKVNNIKREDTLKK